MSTKFKVLVNTGKAENNQVLDVEQGTKALRIKAIAGAQYQLQEIDKDTSFAPNVIKLKRVGKHLHIMLEGSNAADVIIEDYYEVMPQGYNGIVVQAENGNFYEYLTQDPSENGMIWRMPEGSEAVVQALGGSQGNDTGAAVSVVAAKFNPFLGAMGLVGKAAADIAANEGAATTTTDTTIKPNANTTATVAITAITDDTGTSSTDFITKDNKLIYSGTVTGFTANGDKVKLELLAADGVTVISTAYVDTSVTGAGAQNGTWTWAYQTLQNDGKYTLRATIVDVPGNTVNTSAGGQATQVVLIDSSSPMPVVSPEDPLNPIAGKTSLSVDSVTADNMLNTTETGGSVTITGTVRGDFTLNDVVSLSIKGVAYSGTVNSSGVYIIAVSGADLAADPDKTINATVVAHDKAGNAGTITATKVYTLEPAVTTAVTINAISLDTGTSNSDFVTKDNNGLTVTGTLSTALTAGQKLWYSNDNGVTWTDITANVSGTTVSHIDAALISTNTIQMRVESPGGNFGSSATQLVIIDTSSTTNQPDNSTDPNTTATITISSIDDGNSTLTATTGSKDTGASASDFVTSDNDLSFYGTTTGFNGSAGAQVLVQILNASNAVVAEKYVTPDAQGQWKFDNQANADLADGSYTIAASIVDKAGNPVKTDTHALVIKTSVDPSDPNKTATVDITSMTTDSGVSGSDFITNDNLLTYSGTVTGFTANGDKVKVELLAANGTTVIATAYVDVTATTGGAGTWTWAYETLQTDGQYTVRGTLVDAAGNRVNPTAPVNGTGGGQDTQVIVIDTSGGTVQPSGQPDPNTTATVDITSMTTDSGVSDSDFITNDNTLTYSGTVTGFTANGDKVKVELLAANATTVIATTYVDVTLTTGGAGTWSWPYETTQIDGQYTVRATIVDISGNRVNPNAPVNGTGGGQDTQVIVIDTSGGTVQPSGQPDPNTTATVDITSMTTDSGVSGSDFITNDNLLTYSGTVTGFTANGDKVKVELLATNGTTVIATAYVDVTATTGSAGIWSWPYETTLVDGQYTVRATIVDAAGNRVNPTAPVNGTGGGQDTQVIVIDTSGGTVQPSGQPDPNTTATVDITSMTTDSGVSGSDFITNDNLLTYSGTVTGFTANGDKVKVELLATNGTTVIATAYVDVTATTGGNGTWTWPYETTQLQGNYSLRATLVDAAGNRVNSAAGGQDLQAIVIDTSGPAPVISPEDPLNPPAGKTSLSVDSVTADNTLNTTEAAGSVTITGTVRGDFTPGDVVTLTIKGTPYSAAVNASGVYSIAVLGADLAADSDKTIDASVLAHDKAGNPGTITASKAYTIENPVTTTVTITAISLDTGSSATDFVTNDNNGLTVTGTLSTALAAGQKLWYSGNNGATWTDITADVSGTAVSHVDAALTSTNTMQMRVESAGGNFGAAASQLVTIDTSGPAPVISPEDPLNPPAGKTSLSVDSVTADNTLNTTEAAGSVTITGTVRGDFTPGDVVTLTIKGTPYSAAVNASGVYSIAVPGADLAADSDKTIDASVLAHDKAGNPGTITTTKAYTLEAAVTTTVTITAISLDTGSSATDFVTNDNNGLTVTGTLSTALAAGQKLWYSGNNGATWTDITADVSGTAVSHVDAALTSTNTVQMRVESAGGNFGAAASQLVTIDASAPTQNVVITDILDNEGLVTGTVANNGSTDDNRLDLKGTLSAALASNETVAVYDGSTYLGKATVSGTTWTFADPRTLANAQQVSYTAKVVDIAANAGPVSTAYTATVNTSVPSITIASIAGNAVTDVVGGLNGTYDGTERGTSPTTVTTQPVISGTSTNLDGQTITVTINGNHLTATVAAGGAWSVELPHAQAIALNHGNTYTVIAAGTSTGGKVATDINNGMVVNTATPDIPTVLNNYAGTLTPTLNGDALKAVPGSPITYIALETGDTLTVTVGGATYSGTIGSLPAGITYNASTNEWSVNTATAVPTSGALTLASGNTYNVDVSVSAGAVTKTDISTAELVISTANPTITLNEISTDGYLNAAEAGQPLTITGVTDAQVGSTVTLAGFSVTPSPTATVLAGTGGNNTFSVTLTTSQVSAYATAANAGSQDFTATVVNPFGESGSDVENVIIDINAPTFASTGTDVATAQNENIATSVLVYDANATDTGGTVSYNLTGTDASAFNINASTGEVTLKASPDYESKTSYSFSVVATDLAGNTATKPVTLAINNVDEVAPTITSAATAPGVFENAAANTVVHTAAATDTDFSSPATANSVTYSLKTGTGDTTKFSIDSTSGEVTLTEVPDFETQPSYTFTVVATDAEGNFSEQMVSLSVLNVDEEAPVFTSPVVAPGVFENAAANTVVYTATATDTDFNSPATATSVTYSLKAATGDVGKFSINSTSGEVTLTE